MSYVGVRFLVGPVESSGSAEEEGEANKSMVEEHLG
jgi:hypothetical protein